MVFLNNRDTNTPLYRSLKALPKIELHRHLEGTLRLDTLAEIARTYQMDLPGYTIEDIRPLVQITDDDKAHAKTYLSKFAILRAFYKSPEIIDRIAYEAVADAASENTAYFELRFTPLALSREKDFPLTDVTDWVIAATRRASHDFGIEVRLILSMNRNESVEIGQAVVEIAAARQSQGVVGVDLAGNESEFPGAEFEPVFRRAREAGLSVTIHAGEWAGPESVRLAIETLGAQRLGHGVRIVENSDLVQIARERGIIFEVCPTSNIQSGVIRSYELHPLRDMYQMGLLTTINTDNTSVSALNLTDEYARTVEYLGFSLDDLKQHVINAARAAFLPSAEREKLVGRLMAELYPNAAKAPAPPRR